MWDGQCLSRPRLKMDPSGNLSESIELQMPSGDYSRFKDEISMLKDKVAHLQSQLEESEHETIMAAEIGQQLLEQKTSLEALREQERNTYTAKLEDLIQENFNLSAKLESREKLLETYDDEDKRKKQEQEKEQMILLYDKKINDLKHDIKKAKLTHDEEASQLNLVIQQNNEIIKNLQSEILEEKEKIRAAEFKSANDGEIEELKTAIEICHQAKRQVENKLCEMIHDNERRNLESENLRQRLTELNEELNEKTRQIEDCYQHLEDANNTISELNLEVNNQQMELKSRGHSKKGNSLFGELEDKRVVAERNLAIFKVRYDSLRKAYNNAKHEMVQMRYQVLGFLQTRTGDNADRLRIEQLERSLTAQRADSAMLSAKVKQLQQYEKDQNPTNKIKECMESFQGNDSLKHYVNLLLVNAEESKCNIETLQKELEFARFRLIAKDDKLQETERKLYTATYSADKFRNESIKVKLKVDEMKSKFDAEKEKTVELEGLLKELGIIDRSPTSTKDFGKIMEEKKLVLPRYLQPASSCKEDSKKATEEKQVATSSSANEEEPSRKLKKLDEENENNWLMAEQGRPVPVLTEKELKEKCCRLLLNTLPRDLAEEYVKEYQNGNSKEDVSDASSLRRSRKNRSDKDGSKSRKVSFKDEVDVHEIDENNSGEANVNLKNKEKLLESDGMASTDTKENNRDPRDVIVDDQSQGVDCKVQ